jgi:hypothetical protein
MPNCFVFAIGGTGSRVLRSLTHLLAAGVKPKNSFDIIPIIIDPHHSNKDLQRTEALMNSYKEIKEAAEPAEKDGFFSATIKTIKDANTKADIETSFTFVLEGAESRFSDYIGYNKMGDENKALTELLFSGYSKDKNKNVCKLLDIEMDIGFVGNPNVGSVVLNQIVESKVYKAFATMFNPGDRIFIISSIFGGTGAAGFPCLLKNIRKGTIESGINQHLKEAKVGAVSVLPYFKLQDDGNSPINYADFVAKTKSALHYYKDNVTNGSVSAMYYIGDKPSGDGGYKNDAGHGGQQNNANFVEMVGAFSIIDFLNLPDDALKWDTAKGKAAAPIYREFGIKEEAKDIPQPHFFHLGVDHEVLLKKPLSQFALFRRFMKEEFPAKTGKIAWSTLEPKLDVNFIDDVFYRSKMASFFKDFDDWLEELNSNNRGFSPFDLKSSELSMYIKWPDKAKNFRFTYDKGNGVFGLGNGFNEYLNKFAREKYKTKEQKLLDMFSKATKDILEKEYKL